MCGHQYFQRIFNIRSIIIVLLLITIYFLNFHDSFKSSPSPSSSSSSPKILFHTIDTRKKDLNKIRSLSELDKKYRTSKGLLHRYTRFYEHYLSKYRDTNFDLLEIGLGCGMSWGVCVSAALWREYFGPKANIHFIEYLKRLIDDIQSKSPTYKNSTLGQFIYSLEISDKLCLLTKK